MVSVKSFMIPREKFVTVERDTNAQTAARIMRDRGIGSLFVMKPEARVPFFAAAGVLFLATVIAASYRTRYAKTFEGEGPSTPTILE